MGFTRDCSKLLGLSVYIINKAQVDGPNSYKQPSLYPFAVRSLLPQKLRVSPSSASFAMVRKRFTDAEKGFQLEKFLKKVGVGKDDRYFWKQVGKALLCTYAIIGAVWVYNETSPLGWWTLKPRPKEERELAHLYERREFPYPGDEEAMKEFVTKGGMIGTAIGPKGFVDTDKDAYNYQKELQDKKFEKEAQKLWKSMKKEVLVELKEKGFIVE